MINKNTHKHFEQNNQIQSTIIKNSTTNKQRGSFINVHQIIQDHQENRQSYIHLQDRPIEQEDHHINIQNYPQKASVSSPRRSLIRQNQIWQTNIPIKTSYKQQLRIINDQYYGQNVPTQTIVFLQKMKYLLIKQQQSLRNLRKQHIDLLITSIKTQFKKIRDQLVNQIDNWCQRVEQQQIQYFIRKGQIDISGQIAQLTTKISIRRQQIDNKIKQMNQVVSYHQLVNKQQALKGNQYIKKTVKSVWSKDYQQEVWDYQDQAYRIRNRLPKLSFLPERGLEHKKQLYIRIDSLLNRHQLFKLNDEMIKTQLINKINNKQLNRLKQQQKQRQQSNLQQMKRRQQIYQSLLQLRRKQIDEQSQKIALKYGLQ